MNGAIKMAWCANDENIPKMEHVRRTSGFRTEVNEELPTHNECNEHGSEG